MSNANATAQETKTEERTLGAADLRTRLANLLKLRRKAPKINKILFQVVHRNVDVEEAIPEFVRETEEWLGQMYALAAEVREVPDHININIGGENISPKLGVEAIVTGSEAERRKRLIGYLKEFMGN